MTVKIAMIGTGYVGLVTGACFAEIGHDVVCVDKDERKIAILKSGGVPIYEQGLDALVARNVKAGRLRFSLNVEESCADREAVFLAVGTPSQKDTGRADLSYVYAAAAEVAKALQNFAVIISKSTVPVGTNRKVADIALQNASDPSFVAVASNPEFLREGVAIRDFLEPDRVVVGVENERALSIMRRIYAPIVQADIPLVVTGIETAEIIKYAANGFLAVKISFINEISDLCEATGANVEDVAYGIGLDKRIGSAYLQVGPGWGGSCFPKDTRALHVTAQDAGVSDKIIEAAIEANSDRKAKMAQRVIDVCGGSLTGKKVCVLGVTFKGQTDDMRESPSLDVLPRLLKAGASVSAYDPSNPREAAHLLPGVKMEEDPMAAARDSDVLVVMAEWKVFKSLNLRALAATMRTPIMVDLRNLFDPKTVLASGFTSYKGLGI